MLLCLSDAVYGEVMFALREFATDVTSVEHVKNYSCFRDLVLNKSDFTMLGHRNEEIEPCGCHH